METEAASFRPVLNDVHSRLNRCEPRAVVRPTSLDALRDAVLGAGRAGLPVVACGGRHAMGGQQFVAGGVVLDTAGLDRVLSFDAERGEIEAEAGIRWPALMDWLDAAQPDGRGFGIAQKQTGADGFSLGGSLAANVHGRGLRLPPIVGQVESFRLVGPDGEVRTCSRTESPELFALAIGGYGLFGIVASVRLRLVRRRKLERLVEVLDTERLPAAFDAAIAGGALYGDFQFSIDLDSEDGMRRGVFARYRPVPDDVPLSPDRRELLAGDWRELLHLAHVRPSEAYLRYVAHYLATSGQVYGSDEHQRGLYLDDYHLELDRRLGGRGSEMISEVYVPRAELPSLLEAVREDFRRHRAPLVYGTVRLVEADRETFLAWAREPWACVVVNLHVDHDAAGIERAAGHFRRLVDRAAERGGSYYLTYHRFVGRDRLEACHPRIGEFLRRKRELDPDERFQSDWYRHLKTQLDVR